MSDYDAMEMPKECLWVYKNLVQPNYATPRRPEVWLPEGDSPTKKNHRWSKGWKLNPLNWVNTGIVREVGDKDIIELPIQQAALKLQYDSAHPSF